MANIFEKVAIKKPEVSRFDLSHDVKTSFNMGELVPTCCMEVVPGDKFDIQVTNMLRFAPLISPVMHRVNVRTEYFFVPNRILWSGWEDWITRNTDVEHPYLNQRSGNEPGTISDYLGYPTGLTDITVKVNPFPIAAYLKIWDDYYRDQNLQDELFTPLIAGNNTSGSNNNDIYYFSYPLRRAWRRDYFTSALPFAQKGDSVQIPLVNQQNVPVTLTTEFPTAAGQIRAAASGDLITDATNLTVNGTGQLLADRPTTDLPSVYDPNGSLEVDIQEEAATINSLRIAFALQRFLERLARVGSRYVEYLKGVFNVRSSDARLQRPEYIGGFTQNMTISEVLATATAVDAEGTPLVPQGNMAGHGISVGSGNTLSYYAEEHGWIIGITSVFPVTAYQQGLHRSLGQRFDPYDYLTPDFAHIGEQAIQNGEIYAVGTAAELAVTFGYIPRYAEYRFVNSRVSGDMQDSLIYWHLGRTFNAMPVLDGDFVSCSDDNTLNRIFAVTDPAVDKIYAHIFLNISAVRRLPKYGIPAGL